MTVEGSPSGFQKVPPTTWAVSTAKQRKRSSTWAMSESVWSSTSVIRSGGAEPSVQPGINRTRASDVASRRVIGQLCHRSRALASPGPCVRLFWSMNADWLTVVSVRALEEQLERVGWSVRARERRGTDLIIDADARGEPARITALSPFSTAGDVTEVMVEPLFLRLDLGPRDQELLRWSVRSISEPLPLYLGGPADVGFLVQIAEGPGSLSVAIHGHVNASMGSGVLAPKVLFDMVASQRPSLAGGDPRRDRRPLDPDRAVSEAICSTKKDPGTRLLAVGALGVTFASLAAGVGMALMGLAEIGLVVAASGTSSAIPYFVASRQRGRDPGHSLDMSLLDMLRASELFETAKVEGQGSALPVPVVTSGPAGREAIAGVLRSSLIRGSSAERGLEIRIGRWNILWPPDTLAACQLVPSSWVVCELSGDEGTLLQAPDWARQHRTRTSVRWLITGEEIARGDLADLLVIMARRTLDQRSAPYR